jgi:crotonobetainyl-CoA:carnitine CoA-transferase CaiB-like acyl-CoA transferase
MLQGTTVIELASVLAGPSAGQFFAELGAEVIKVENIHAGGDVTRSWKIGGEKTDDRSAYFCSINWGKKSIAIDLNSTEGKEIIYSLSRNADIVISSFKPGDGEKLEVDYRKLSAINDKLIYAQVTGYGSDNPRVGYDAIIQAEAGYIFMNGEPGGASLKIPVALMDILAGHHLKEGILLAMLQRTKTGKGSLVEVSLIQAAVSSLANQATNWLVGGRIPQKQGSAHPNIAPYGDIFKTSDGYEILLAVGNDRQFRDLCQGLGLAALGSDARFSTNPQRVIHRKDLTGLLGESIQRFTREQLLSKLHATNVPAGAIQNIEQLFQMPEASEMILRSGSLSGIRNFAHLQSLPSHFLPPPHFGEHTREILSKSLEMDENTIRNLFVRGVVA